MSEFLKNLKNAVENEEFNSEAAKRINEINELAEKKTGQEVNERLKKSGAKNSVEEDEVGELNSEYEEKMAEMKKVDAINTQIANLMQMDDMVLLSIDDIVNHVKTLEENFIGKFDENDKDKLKNLEEKIKELKEKYGEFIK